MGWRHLDEVAEHVVVLDLQPGDAGRLGIARLHPGDQPAAVVAQRAQFVQGGIVARRDEAAVAGQQRRLRRQGRAQPLDQRVLAAQRRRDIPRGRDRAVGRLQAGPGAAGAGGDQPASSPATASAPRIAARSRGPPRPRLSRDSARSMSGQWRSAARRSAAQPSSSISQNRDLVEARGDRRHIGQRAAQAGRQQARAGAGDGAVDGGEQGARAPAASASVSSRLRRVAASISITAPSASRRGAAAAASRPFWVSAT